MSIFVIYLIVSVALIAGAELGRGATQKRYLHVLNTKYRSPDAPQWSAEMFAKPKKTKAQPLKQNSSR